MDDATLDLIQLCAVNHNGKEWTYTVIHSQNMNASESNMQIWETDNSCIISKYWSVSEHCIVALNIMGTYQRKKSSTAAENIPL